MSRFLFQSAERGALPILFAAVSPAAQPGGYYGPSGFQEMNGDPGPAAIPRQALDEAVATRLWRLSEQLTGVRIRDSAEAMRRPMSYRPVSPVYDSRVTVM